MTSKSTNDDVIGDVPRIDDLMAARLPVVEPDCKPARWTLARVRETFKIKTRKVVSK